MAKQNVYTRHGLKGFFEKNWLLVPIILIGVVAVAIIEATLLYRTAPIPILQVQEIADTQLTGGPNRFDYSYLDSHTRLLYLIHSASNTLIIFDTDSRKMVANIPGIADAHDVPVASDHWLIFVTSNTANQVVIMNAHTNSIISRIPVGDSPDGLIYNQPDHKVFVADEAGQNDAVIDAHTQRRIAEIPLGGDAGDIEYDTISHHIYAVVATLNQLLTIDPVSDTIIARAPLPGCQGGQDLVLDEQQRVAYVDCADNAALLMLDLASMKVLSTQSVGNNPDLMALDSGWHYLYVASESGVVSVFDVHERTIKEVDDGFVDPGGAHTIAVDQQTHYIYLPLENVGGMPVLRIALFQHSTD
jgi:YVTN family beta-propeller protein